MLNMDGKEPERVVIAKPVASKPSCSWFTSFSELPAGAINSSPANAGSEIAVAAIRPKTVRLKPMISHNPPGFVISQDNRLGGQVSTASDKVPKSDGKPGVVYKPLAKLVSNTAFSNLGNMGNFSTSHQRTLPALAARTQAQPDQDNQCLGSQFDSAIQQSALLSVENFLSPEPSSWKALQNVEQNVKCLSTSARGDRLSYDGYNWRKYGQKQVKGGEYPRSYYKCTHPNCPVKKKVERSFDGQIVEIVYKGEHSHPKPQPLKRNSSGTHGPGFVSDGIDQDFPNGLLLNSHIDERNEGSKGRLENQNEQGVSALPNNHGNLHLFNGPIAVGVTNACVVTSENPCGVIAACEFEDGSKGKAGEFDEPGSKKRKSDSQSNKTGISGEAAQEAWTLVQNSTDSEISGDGFRWRKYGQKVVKGNPYPRSYYRCTRLKCNVRKYVERTLEDPNAFVITYEGKHNHDIPQRKTNSVAAERGGLL